MAIGDTVQAGLMRIDTSAYERAGQANANANMAFGNALNQVAKGFIEGQEKKARTEEMTGYLMNQGVSEKDAKAIAKNPFLQKEYQRKKATEAQMQMEGNRIAAQQSIAAANRRSAEGMASDKAAQIQSEKDLIRAEADELKQITSEANQFMRTRPQTETPEFSNLLEQFSPDQIPGTPEFEAKELSEPMGARPPLMASFATDKPNFEMFNVGKAPIEQQLPESFQGLAGRIIDMADNGEISQPAADLALNRIQAQAMAEQKDGPTRSEILAREKFEYEKAQDAEENKPMPPVDPVYKEAAINAIDSAIEKSKGFFATGITGQALQGFAGTDARDLAQAISTVEAAVGFDRLQEMRDSSKTGGALGAINTKELELLSNSLGSLDPLQKPETLRKNLESIKEKYVKILKSVEAEKYAFENDITFKTPKEAMDFVDNFNASSPQQPAPQSRDELLKQEADLQRRLNERLLNNPPVQQFRGI
jgi:hypothetical protein